MIERVRFVTDVGNIYWHKAVDNANKVALPISKESFKELKVKLDGAEINYYARCGTSTAVILANQADSRWLIKLAGVGSEKLVPLNDKSKTQAVFGNTSYKYIRNKEYMRLGTDEALKLADVLNRKGIRFSGKVNENNTIITLDTLYKETAQKLYSGLKAARQQSKLKPLPKLVVVGTVPYSTIKNKAIISPKVKPAEFYALKPYMAELGMRFAGVMGDNRLIIAVEENAVEKFHKDVDAAINLSLVTSGLKERGITKHQLEVLKPVMIKSARADTLAVVNYVDARYTDEQLHKISEHLERYISQDEIAKFNDSNGYLAKLQEVKAELDQSIELAQIIGNTSYSKEQMQALQQAFNAGVSPELLGIWNETYTVEEMKNISSSFLSADFEHLQEIMQAHESVPEPEL